MKLLFDHQAFSLQRHGGVSRYFHELTTRIAAMGDCGVEIFAPFFVGGNFPAAGLRPRGLALPFSARTAGTTRYANDLLSRWANRRRKGIDVYHETYYSMSDAAPPGAWRVITVFDMIHEKFPGSFSRSDATARIKKHAIERADHIVCISEHTRRDLIDLTGVPADRTSVVHLGHGLSVGSGAVRSIPEVGDRPFLLYVGQRSGYKNFELLLEALGKSPNFVAGHSLVCFGGGPFTDRERVLVAASGLDPAHVHQLSGMDDMLQSLYCSAGAMVYPSLYEGFGIPPLEAMSYGCPVACSNAGSVPEVVGDAAELFDPYDAGSIRNAVASVLESPIRASELAMLGSERQKLFSWDRCARETVEVYRRRA